MSTGEPNTMVVLIRRSTPCGAWNSNGISTPEVSPLTAPVGTVRIQRFSDSASG